MTGMTAQFTTLASGSAGNAALVRCDDTHWLIDIGLDPTELDRRLALAGTGWSQIRGVLMTHRHSDHWSRRSIARCAETRTPVHCHRDHAVAFRGAVPEFEFMERQRLVQPYVGERPITITPHWQCRALRVRHDGGATFGFRFDQTVASELPRSFAYVADLGCWDRGLLERLLNVDLLAVEFNHDPDLLRQSSRPPWLVNRILGDEGHLSNAQASSLVGEIIRHSHKVNLTQLVLLHLSGECNSSELASATARAELNKAGSFATVFAASQTQPSPQFTVGQSHPMSETAMPTRLVQANLF